MRTLKVQLQGGATVRRTVASLALLALFFSPTFVFAQAPADPTVPPANTEEVTISPIKFTPQIRLPGFTGGEITGDTLGNYFRALYVYFISSVGAVAVAMIIFGGFRWITAAGNASKIQAAQETINSALIGLVLALTSVLILNTINPSLTRFQIPTVSLIEQRLQRSLFCSDSEPLAKAAGARARCGENVTYTDADGKQQTCIGTFVEPSPNPRTRNSLICAYDKQTNAFVPTTIERLCTDSTFSSNNQCDNANRLIKTQIDPSTGPSFRPYASPPMENGVSLACRKHRDQLGRDSCSLNPILSCTAIDPGAVRLQCNFGNGRDTPCWQDGRPAQFGIDIFNQTICSDSESAAVTTDAICCAFKGTPSAKRCQEGQPHYLDLNPNTGYAEFPVSDCADIAPGCSSKCWILVGIANYNGF